MSSTTNRRRARSRKRRLLRRLSTLAFIIAAILLLAFAALTIKEMMDVREQDDVRDLYPGSNAAALSLSLNAQAAELEPVEQPKVFQQDFTALYEVNPDVVGWLQAGESIDAPVLYRDNEYYMDHSFYGNPSTLGELFVDEANDEWDTDPYVIIYGHNKKNGTMFGSLSGYREAEYLKQHGIVEFRTVYDEEPKQYVPFALFDASMIEGNSNYFHLRKFSIFEEQNVESITSYLSEMKARSLYEIPVEVTPEDRILVLVTCSYYDDNGRLLLFCRELRENETVETVNAQLATIAGEAAVE